MVPGVEGSSPFTHPTEYQGLGAIPIPDSFSTQGCSQVVRQGTLTPSSAGSSPAIPATPFRMAPSFFHMCHAPLAQSVEHLPFKQGVRGSNPRRGTKPKPAYPQWIHGFSFVFNGFRVSRFSALCQDFMERVQFCGTNYTRNYTRKAPA